MKAWEVVEAAKTKPFGFTPFYEVIYHDPYVPELNEDDLVMVGITLDQTILQKSDCVVITAAHSDYDWQWIVENSQLVIDTRNATRDVVANSGRVVKL